MYLLSLDIFYLNKKEPKILCYMTESFLAQTFVPRKHNMATWTMGLHEYSVEMVEKTSRQLIFGMHSDLMCQLKNIKNKKCNQDAISKMLPRKIVHQ